MKDRPILFSGSMVRAILDGRKTVTRRIVKPAHVEHLEFLGGSGTDEPTTSADVDLTYGPIAEEREDGSLGKATDQWRLSSAEYPEEGAIAIGQLYGAPGNLLWVRELCCAKELTDDEAVEYAVQCGDPEYPRFGLDGVLYPADAHFRPIENSIEASEAWGKLHIYRGKRGAVVPPIHMPRWASRLTLRITKVRVERLQEISNVESEAEGVTHWNCGHPDCFDKAGTPGKHFGPKGAYFELWESINGKGSWDANPWVWVIEFERVNQQEKAA